MLRMRFAGVKPRLLKAGNAVFEQAHVFDPLKISPPLQQVRIASSCSANNTTLQGFKGYFPMLTTFGTETIMLKVITCCCFFEFVIK